MGLVDPLTICFFTRAAVIARVTLADTLFTDTLILTVQQGAQFVMKSSYIALAIIPLSRQQIYFLLLAFDRLFHDTNDVAFLGFPCFAFTRCPATIVLIYSAPIPVDKAIITWRWTFFLTLGPFAPLTPCAVHRTADFFALPTFNRFSRTTSTIQFFLINRPLSCSGAGITTGLGTMGPGAPLFPNTITSLCLPPIEMVDNFLFVGFSFVALFYVGLIGNIDVVFEWLQNWLAFFFAFKVFQFCCVVGVKVQDFNQFFQLFTLQIPGDFDFAIQSFQVMYFLPDPISPVAYCCFIHHIIQVQLFVFKRAQPDWKISWHRFMSNNAIIYPILQFTSHWWNLSCCRGCQ